MVSDPEIVTLLLNHGADPYETDVSGNDPFMMASIFGRTDNIKNWLNRFCNWDVERKNKFAGSTYHFFFSLISHSHLHTIATQH